jgi:uncharacterized protein
VTEAPHPLIETLGLRAHPEGGWYRETWRSPADVDTDRGRRAAATAILFLLNPGEHSAWHRVRSDELWLWQGGGPLTLRVGGSGDRPGGETAHRLGPGTAPGERPQILVPADAWQRAEPAGDEHVLVGCVVSPGFSFDDFELL